MKFRNLSFFIYLISFTGILSCSSLKDYPDYENYEVKLPERTNDSENSFSIGNNKLLENKWGIWELYLEGNPYERGLANGELSKELIYHQEKAFIDKIKELVPSKFKQSILRNFLRFFNRDLDDHVIDEYKLEIYGLSKNTSHDFDAVAPIYWRTLYYHGAHDIGHALQDLAMVGCTSFAAWGKHTEDGNLILGRNFDFYVNDEFAENKIIAFIHPDEGYKHAFVTWPGMIGAVSGMNEKGLTVTINAGKSSIPLKAKTPISLLTREILQFASNLDEAISIAKKREVFVSESIMVGSDEDNSAILIEVSPKKFGVYRIESSANLLICSNHFQSEIYKDDKRNSKNILESHSEYRFERMDELIKEKEIVSTDLAVNFLRNKEGLKNIELGYGNEKAINQLMAHHGIVFKPHERQMWVSANPNQMGAFVAYDLDEVFKNTSSGNLNYCSFSDQNLVIPEDDFLDTDEYFNYLQFKDKFKEIQNKTKNGGFFKETELISFLNLNPEFWKGYFVVGEFYFSQKEYEKAIKYYHMAMEKEISSLSEKQLIEKKIIRCQRKIK